MNEPNSTPETDAHQLKPEMAYDRLWSDFARQLERERDELREALSGRTVSCSQCNEAGYKLAGFEAEVAGLRAENEDLRQELDELRAGAVHSCHDQCQRPGCVRRRENEAMREAIREAYDAINASPYPDQQALDKIKPFITP